MSAADEVLDILEAQRGTAVSGERIAARLGLSRAAVWKAVSALKDRGLKLAIGSSSRNTKLILAQTDLGGYFDAVSDGTNITRSKPDPEVFLKAAAFLGLPPSACAVVEDAVAGIDAANAGGFLSIGIGDAAAYAKTASPITSLADILSMDCF